MGDTIKVEAYLTVEGRRNSWRKEAPVSYGRVVKVTYSKPSVVKRDQIVVKVALVGKGTFLVVCFSSLFHVLHLQRSIYHLHMMSRPRLVWFCV